MCAIVVREPLACRATRQSMMMLPLRELLHIDDVTLRDGQQLTAEMMPPTALVGTWSGRVRELTLDHDIRGRAAGAAYRPTAPGWRVGRRRAGHIVR